MGATLTTDKKAIFGNAKNNYLNASSGFASWAFTLDHKRIGLMYLIGVTGALLLAGVFALVLRTHLWFHNTDTAGLLTDDQYNQMFTLHGAVMVFAFIIPSIPAALGNFVLPMMLGAKDVAFPRLNLCSFYLWIIGTVMLLCAILVGGGLDTGWTFYTPYSIETETGVIWATFGAFVLGFSSIFTGLNFLVTVNTMRAPGQTWFKLPLFIWGLYATSIIQILATPVLGITLLLLIAEKTMHIGIFDPTYGGDPVLFQHFFWFYSHPAVYIMILATHGSHQRTDVGIQSQEDFWLLIHRIFQCRDCISGLPGLGTSHVHQRSVARGQSDFQRDYIFCRDSVGGQSLQLAGHDVQRLDRADNANVLCVVFHLLVRNRWIDRIAAGHALHGYSAARHLLCCRSLPLRCCRWNADGAAGWGVPLVAQRCLAACTTTRWDASVVSWSSVDSV